MNPTLLRRILLSSNLVLGLGLISTWIVDPYTLFYQKSFNRPTSSLFRSLPKFSPQNPFSEYDRLLLGRNLFGYGIQPETAVKQSNILDDYLFLGRSRRPDGDRAFLRNTVTGETRTVGIGDRIGDYRIDQIESQSLMLSKGEEQHVLKR